MGDQPTAGAENAADKKTIDVTGQLDKAERISVLDTLSDAPPIPRRAIERAALGDPVTEFSRDQYHKAAKLLNGSLANEDELEKIGTLPIIEHYLNEHPAGIEPDNFWINDLDGNHNITRSEIESRKSESLITLTPQEQTLLPIISKVAAYSSEGISKESIRAAATRAMELHQEREKDAASSAENRALVERIMKGLPKEKFVELGGSLTREKLDELVNDKHFKDAPAERQLAIKELRAHFPEFIDTSKFDRSSVCFADLEDFRDKNTLGKVTYASDAVTDALTRNNNQLFMKLAGNDLNSRGENPNQFKKPEGMELSHDHIKGLLKQPTLTDHNVRRVLNYLNDHYDQIKNASKSGHNGITLADIQAHPLQALQARKVRNLAQRLDYNWDKIAEKIPGANRPGSMTNSFTKEALVKVLAGVAKENERDKTLVDSKNPESEANKELQRVLSDVLERYDIINDHPLASISRADINRRFLSYEARSQNDRMRYIDLNLPADRPGMYRSNYSDSRTPRSVEVENGQTGEKLVYELHGDGNWYHHAAGKEPVAIEGMRYDERTGKFTWSTK